jgi:acyl carrier protein
MIRPLMNLTSCDKILIWSEKVVEQITAFITTEILKDPSRQIGEDQPLISSGLIDSFGLVDLALFVEESFGVRIEDVELTSSVFDTTAELAQLISQKLPGPTQ